MMEKRPFVSLSVCFVLVLTILLPVEGFLGRYYCASSWRRWQIWSRPSSSPTTAHDSTTVPLRREPQVRKKSKNRHAPGYWQNISNVESELFQFWTNLGVTSVSDCVVPNEALLNHFERHDLRYAIVSHGGRQRLSQKLGGARIMPGRWTVAVESSPELQALLENETHAGMLSRTLPPLSPQQKKEQPHVASVESNRTRWNHSPKRKPKGYWTIETLLQELYQYLDDYQERKKRPSVWMPRPGEFKREGRDDLRQAMSRFGGCNGICKLAGLVPYREWYYFEGQYELLVDLRDYLDKYHDGDHSLFPCASDMKRHGYHQLYSLTQFYGGSTFVANRFDMKYIHAHNTHDDLNYGPFSIDTAIDLMRFIRAREMRKKGPLKRRAIAMPRQQTLLANGEEKLHDEIMEIGGYENVARRLGLAYFD